MDEHTLSLNGDALGVSNMPDREYLGSFNAVDMRLRAQRLTERSAAQIPQCQGAGDGRLVRLMCRGAQDVVEDQGTYTAVNLIGWSFVGGAENEVRVHCAVGFVVNEQGRGDRVADADDGVARCDVVPVGCVLTPFESTRAA